MKVNNVYFNVPGGSGFGPDFEDWDTAVAYVEERWHSEFVRQFIDVRENDTNGDRLVKRYEIPNPLTKLEGKDLNASIG